jgi:phage terminase large subunit-like protein
MFPATGPLPRDRYPKHLEFFRAGETHRERLFMAGNRCGKTTAGAYETALHLTGLYPDWWDGRRIPCPIDAWAAGETGAAVRDIVQRELLGPPNALGTGMIPAHLILDLATGRGVADAIDSVYVRHVSGGTSALGFKSFAQGRENFQGTSKNWVWIDEECPMDVYQECLMRTMVTAGDPRGGMLILTFTPLKGWSEVIEAFLGVSGDSPNPLDPDASSDRVH